MRRRTALTRLALLAAVASVALGAVAAPSAPAPAPTLKVQPRPVTIPRVPPTAKPATNVVVTPAGIAPARGEDPLKPFIRRTFKNAGTCILGTDCILIGRRFGNHSPGQPWPSARRLHIMRIADGKELQIEPTAWTDNVIAFRRLESHPAGRYTVVIRDVYGKGLSNAFFVELVPPNKTKNPDLDGDGHEDIAFGGDDCDDRDPAVKPGNPEIPDPEERDHDCNPNTFGIRDRDSDGEPDALSCTVDVVGSGLDRALEWTCGVDCDDTNSSIKNGSMKCDGRSPTTIFVCRGKTKSRVDPRMAVTGIWEPFNCADFGGGTCAAQPNGTGSCR